MRILLASCLALSLLCLALGCGDTPAPGPTPDPAPGSEPADPILPAMPEPGERPTVNPSTVDEPTRKAAVQACNRFGLSLYHQVRTKKGNVFLSPVSIHQALGLAYLGSRGKTAAQMKAALAIELPPFRYRPAAGAIQLDLFYPADDAGYRLVAANALWGQEAYTVEKDYLDGARRYFGASLRRVDFKGKPVEAAGSINTWVKERTAGKITELVSPALINPMTRLVLTNAVYFKGAWKHPFKPGKTRAGTFHLLDGATVSVPMMHQKGYFTVRDQGLYRAIVLPYRGKRLEMVVVLPRQKDGIKNLDEDMDGDTVVSFLTGPGRSRETRLALPRFKMECTLNLKSHLQALGMTLAFDRKDADFRGISRDREGLFLAEAVHKAYVDVYEQGTEAAAATGVVAEAKSKPYSFVVDRPFLFFLRDRTTGTILFLGRCLNPAQVR